MIMLTKDMILDKKRFNLMINSKIENYIRSNYPKNLSEFEFKKIKDLTLNQLIDKINLTVILNTPEKELPHLNSLIKSGDLEMLEKFLNKNIPNYKYLVKKEITIFLKNLENHE